MLNNIDMKDKEKDSYLAPESEELVLHEKVMSNYSSGLENGSNGENWDW